MPTVEIPADWIPDGYELTGRMVDCKSTHSGDKTPVLAYPGVASDSGTFAMIYPELRRKPKLKRIVFEVAGGRRD